MKKVILSTILAFVSAMWGLAGTITSSGTLTNLTPAGFGSGTDNADLDAENVGMGGFVVFHSVPEGTNLSGQPWDLGIVDQKPAYISAIDGSLSTSSGGWANYDDVTLGGNLYNTGGIVNSPGAGAETEVFNFTIGAGVPENLKIGLVVDNSDSANWDVTNVRIEGPNAETADQEVITDGGLDVVQFNLSGSVEDEIYTVYATSAPSGIVIGAITFDSDVPPIDLTDPTDTDNDTMGDNWENFYFGDLTSSDGTGDEDSDGATDLQEWTALSNPTKMDTDGDSLTDGDEINTHLTSPILVDTDLDTFNDGFEVANGTDPTDDESFPLPSATLWSLDFEPIPGIFPSNPVLMTGSDSTSGIFSGLWNAFDITGHDGTDTDPSMSLFNARGEVSPVTFSIKGIISGWSNAPGPSAISNDYLFVGAGNADASATWEISGLNPATEFIFYPYGGVARDMLLTVDTNGNGLITDETPTLVPGTGIEFAITSDAAGKIIGSIEAGSTTEANWGGWQLASTSDVVIIDTDMDGLSDNAESAAGTDRFNPDTDGDGQSDGAEVRAAGTDPLDPNSFLRITNILYDGTNVDLTWTSIVGKVYSVEASTDLEIWTPLLTDLDADAGPATSAEIDTPGATTFKAYRVVIRR
jgi:hypothetical protein